MCFGELKVIDKCNESAVSQLLEVGAKDGAATHKAPLRAPLELVPWNPVKLMDPDGRGVLPTSDEVYEMFLRTSHLKRSFILNDA